MTKNYPVIIYRGSYSIILASKVSATLSLARDWLNCLATRRTRGWIHHGVDFHPTKTIPNNTKNLRSYSTWMSRTLVVFASSVAATSNPRHSQHRQRCLPLLHSGLQWHSRAQRPGRIQTHVRLHRSSWSPCRSLWAQGPVSPLRERRFSMPVAHLWLKVAPSLSSMTRTPSTRYQL